jgi:tetratricopeptide (TPR) repeat protein
MLIDLGESSTAEALLAEADGRSVEVAEICNEIAWRLAVAKPKPREAAAAVKLARCAVQRSPNSGAIWNTLGLAEYRLGAWDESINALSRSMELTPGDSAADWLFLAMAHWQKGDKDAARSFYDKAASWMDQHHSKDEELTRFRAEAEALIGGSTMPNGAEAFARRGNQTSSGAADP